MGSTDSALLPLPLPLALPTSFFIWLFLTFVNHYYSPMWRCTTSTHVRKVFISLIHSCLDICIFSNALRLHLGDGNAGWRDIGSLDLKQHHPAVWWLYLGLISSFGYYAADLIMCYFVTNGDNDIIIHHIVACITIAWGMATNVTSATSNAWFLLAAELPIPFVHLRTILYDRWHDKRSKWTPLQIRFSYWNRVIIDFLWLIGRGVLAPIAYGRALWCDGVTRIKYICVVLMFGYYHMVYRIIKRRLVDAVYSNKHLS